MQTLDFVDRLWRISPLADAPAPRVAPLDPFSFLARYSCQMKALLEMNVSSTVWMTRLAVPGMVERKRGAIVNFGSGAALNPTALLAGYSGAKGFIVVRMPSAAFSPLSFLSVTSRFPSRRCRRRRTRAMFPSSFFWPHDWQPEVATPYGVSRPVQSE